MRRRNSKRRRRMPVKIPCAGRGLHPRPERSTPAKAEEQQTENKNQLKDSFRGCLSGFGIADGYLAWVDHSDPAPFLLRRSSWCWCRSGVAPPTGKLHPRESRGTTDRKQESIKRFISGMSFRIWNCGRIFSEGRSFRSRAGPVAPVVLVLVPVGGCTPDRKAPPPRKQGNNRQKTRIN